MDIKKDVWASYISALRKVNERAASDMKAYLQKTNWQVDNDAKQKAIDYAFGLATKYGEASGELACQMYDAVSALESAKVPPAAPAQTATYDEVSKSVVGTMKSNNINTVSNSVARLVKMAGVDTTMQNALRDGAEWAWIPNGDTCAFCLTLASRGWQRASKNAIKNGHAEHIHANCDCTYAIRFDGSSNVDGYDPDALREIYDNAEGMTSRDKINALRRDFYSANRVAGVAPDAKGAELFEPQTRLLVMLRERIGKDIEYNAVDDLTKKLSDDEIIKKIAGADKTKGSCSSCAFAYVGNKCGYDVTDYRGGWSADVFARNGNITQMVELVGGETSRMASDYKSANFLLEKVAMNKEYYFAAGKHAAIVRRTENGLEYLELQSGTRNGFKPLDNDALKYRFGCQKSHKIYGGKIQVPSFLAPVDNFKGNKEFKELLGFLNTEPGKQVKGAGGGIK